jgi:RNA polymerase sigma factor (sigma-70 family)
VAQTTQKPCQSKRFSHLAQTFYWTTFIVAQASQQQVYNLLVNEGHRTFCSGTNSHAEAHMNVHLSFKAGKTPDVEREFHNHIQKLNRRLRAFKPDLVHLHAVVDQAPRQELSTTLNLRLPSGQMAAISTSSTASASVKTAFVDLLGQLTKHKDLLRGHIGRKLRRGDRGQRVSGAVPFEETFASVPQAASGPDATAPGDSVATLSEEDWVVDLDHLREFVQRELQFRALNGQMRSGQVTTDEVIGEVMVAALSHENGNSHLLPEENYFHRLALRSIRQLMHDNADLAEVSLDAPAGTQNVTGSDENTLQYHQPDDSVNEENVIADSGSRTPEEIYANEEMAAQLDAVLQHVGSKDREAFILFTLEGFTIEEIARLSDRPQDDIRQSIHHARERILKKLPERNDFRRQLLQRSRAA